MDKPVSLNDFIKELKPMKPMILSLTLAAMMSALPCAAQTGTAQTNSPQPGAAQTGTTPGNISPQAMQVILNSLFRQARAMHHADLTPEQRAHVEAVHARVNELEKAGAKALHDGDFAAAEADFRESVSITPFSNTYFELAEALTGQGRTAEAIEAYRGGIYGPPYTVTVQNDISVHGQFNPNVRTCPGGGAEAHWMKYALLLSQTGQEAEAVIIYKKALIRVPEADHPGMSLALASDTPSPETFQAAAHVALGLCATFSGSQYDKAMGDFDAARRLRPDSPLANYYYGYGWKNLDPKGAARQAYAAQAKAAFQQAAAFGEGTVKKEAEQALTGFK